MLCFFLSWPLCNCSLSHVTKCFQGLLINCHCFLLITSVHTWDKQGPSSWRDEQHTAVNLSCLSLGHSDSFLPGRMCKIMCHTQQLWKKNIVWIESVSSRWLPLQYLSLHHLAVRRLLDSQYIFFPFSLSPPAGEYLEVHRSCSLSLNTNPRGATTGQLLESRVCPSIGIENYNRRHLWCKWHKLENVLSAVANLEISEELKAKLQDVMVARSLLSIGKVLGEGGCITSVTVLIKLF